MLDIGDNFFGRTALTPQTLANFVRSQQSWEGLLSFHHELATDQFVQYLQAFYIENLKRYDLSWDYMDIVTVVHGAAKLLQPRNYLEIGVRRGRSVCSLAKASPASNIVASDMWLADYAGMPNPGPDFVGGELKRMGHTGDLHFINGDSHVEMPKLRQNNPQLRFDMITVDGDHTEEGARKDLEDVYPMLNVGGVIIFDDISHPDIPYMRSVWDTFAKARPELKTYEYDAVGYGIAFGVKFA